MHLSLGSSKETSLQSGSPNSVRQTSWTSSPSTISGTTIHFSSVMSSQLTLQIRINLSELRYKYVTHVQGVQKTMTFKLRICLTLSLGTPCTRIVSQFRLTFPLFLLSNVKSDKELYRERVFVSASIQVQDSCVFSNLD